MSTIPNLNETPGNTPLHPDDAVTSALLRRRKLPIISLFDLFKLFGNLAEAAIAF
jgi:hypothetical protein